MRPIIPDEPAEKFPVVTPAVSHSRTPFGFCHHLRSAEADASCPCGYRGGIWSKPDDRIVFEMGQTPMMVDGAPEKMLPEADRLTQIADAHFIVRACNAHEALVAALISAREQLENYENVISGERFNDKQINAALELAEGRP